MSLAVLFMGWDWAPFIAHTLMLDLVEHALSPWSTRRVEDGLPVLQPLPQKPVHWGYMDDYGVLALLHRGADLERSVLGQMQRAIRGHFQNADISPHKETLTWGVSPSLGVFIPAESHVLAVVEEKWWLLQEATEHVITLHAISGRAISRLVGMWTWGFTIFHELLSVLSSAYVFIATFDDDFPRAMWGSVRAELTALVALAPLAQCHLGIPWSTTVLMTDASMEGFGVVETPESIEFIQHEARESLLRDARMDGQGRRRVRTRPSSISKKTMLTTRASGTVLSRARTFTTSPPSHDQHEPSSISTVDDDVPRTTSTTSTPLGSSTTGAFMLSPWTSRSIRQKGTSPTRG